jgi:peptide/nickel transport system permease protein
MSAAPETRSVRRRLPSTLVAGLVLAAILVVTAIVAPLFLSGRADGLTAQTRLSPSASHWLGTDEFGRDLFARALVATRLTLLLTVSACALAVVVGVFIGTLVWVLPPRVRAAVLGANAVAVAFPSLVLALIIAAILGPGAWTATLAIGLAGIPAFIRLTSNIASSVMVREYVTTARLLRVPRLVLIRRHVLPNIAESLLVLAASNFAVTLVELSGLSFIGLGVQSPDYDFGKLLSDALASIYTQPSQTVGPGVMIVVTGLAAMLIGDGLAATSNPRTRVRRAKRTGTLTAARAPQDGADVRRSAAVSVRNLRISTGSGVELVKGISFDVERGEIVGLVGESGSGKSLTSMSVAGLVPEGVRAVADGLYAAGHDMLGPVPRSDLARDVALVYQDPISTFNPALRLDRQLTEVARTHLGMSRRTARASLVERFTQLRITKPELRMRQHPHELSGGMLQRAMIASALIADSKLIVADEPTTALDVTVQAEVLRQFVTATESLDAAMLFISHDLKVVEAVCDRVLVMYHGEIVEELTREQLRTRAVTHPYTRKLLAASDYVEAAV